MLKDTPMNNANEVNPTPAGPCVGYKQIASTTPHRNGTAMPAWLTAIANRRRPCSRPRSSSAPATSRNINTPSWLIMPRVPSELAGNKAVCSCGSKAPNNNGPIIRPAAISPITAGWPNQRNNLPMPLAAISNTSNCSRNRASGELACRAPAPALTICCAGAGRDTPA